MSSTTKWVGAVLSLSVLMSLAARRASGQTVLFRDDFNGSSLNRSNWMVGTWDLGRTVFGNVPAVSGGVATLKIDTYNPQRPGSMFKGTEILTKRNFSRGAGIEYEARLRLRGMPDGFISAFYTFQNNSNGTLDEMDFEFLSKWVNKPITGTSETMLLSTWNDWDKKKPVYNDGVHHRDKKLTVSSLDLSQFNTFKIRWLKDRIEWFVNGRYLWETKSARPDAAMPLKLNLWAAKSNWLEAFNAYYNPTSNRYANRSFYFDVDWVQVKTHGWRTTSPTATSVPEPGVIGMLAGAALLLLRRRRALASA